MPALPSPAKPSPEAAARAFITPSRKRPRQPEHVPPGAMPFPLPTSSGTLAAWRWGEGPRVLLVHGWEGSHADMLPFVEPLLAAGLSPVAVDLPAHGASPGTTATLPQMAKALGEAAAVIGPLRGIVAHSMGCPVAVTALTFGLEAERAVLVSTPARYVDKALKIAESLGFGEAEWKAMEAALLAAGTELHSMVLPVYASRCRQPALVLHSADDRTVSIEDGRETAESWPGAKFVAVDGLGHSRILRDPEIIGRSVEFLVQEG